MVHRGSCHCGKVAYEVEGDIDSGMACNCSMCARRASLLWFVPRERLVLTTREEDAATYRFNRHAIRHRFCAACGIHAFGEARDPQGREMAAVNLRTVEGLDLERIPVTHFDGRSL